MLIVYRRTSTFWYKHTGRFVFCRIFYDAPVRFLSIALGGFGVGVVFYNAPMRMSCEALVLYYIMTHRVGVYGVHGVWCANVLVCTGAFSVPEHQGDL